MTSPRDALLSARSPMSNKEKFEGMKHGLIENNERK